MKTWIRSLREKRRLFVSRTSDTTFARILLTPTAFMVMVLGIFPIVYSFGLSFFRYRLNRPGAPSFVGLGNYIRMVNDAEFWASMGRTLYFTVTSVGLTVLLGLAIALLLRRDIKGKTMFVTLLLIPWAIPKVVSGLIWRWIFDGSYGILNALAVKFGIVEGYQWWFNKSPIVALTLVVIVEMWKRAPFSAIMMLAGLNDIPAHLYRAAEIDGARSWHKFKYVTLPGIKHILMVVLILETAWSLKTFDTIYVLTSGGPGTSTTVAYYYAQKQAFNYLDLGYGSALAYTITLAVIGLTIFYSRALRNA